MQRSSLKRRQLAAGLLVALLALLAAGCGSSSSNDDAATKSKTVPEAQVRAEVDELLTARGTFKPPPTSGPKPRSGVKVTVIFCGPACKAGVGAVEAAKELGWQTKVYDTKGDPTKADAGIRSAIADGSDAIVLHYIDCKYAKGAFREAKRAGIPVIALESFDCNYQSPGEQPLFTADVRFGVGDGSYAEYVRAWGAAQAKYALSLDPNAKLELFMEDTSYGSLAVGDGYKDVFDSCAGDCKLTVKEFPYSAMTGQGLQTLAQQELLRQPDTTTVGVTYEGIAITGVLQAVRSTNDELALAVGEGTSTMDVVRTRKAPTFGAGLSQIWEGWAAIDTVNRVLNDKPVANSGMGLQLFDKEHNVPATGDHYVDPIDFKRYYREAWGL